MSGAIIVLDGPDAAGKTTLAEAMQRQLGDACCSYEHLTYIKENYAMWRANYNACFSAVANARHGKVHIIDRGWISENIYSAVYRGGSKLQYDVRGFDRISQRFGAIYVMCAPSPDFAVLNHARMHANREEMYAPDERIRQVAEKYYLLAHGGSKITQPYDYVDSMMGVFNLRNDVLPYDISTIPPVEAASSSEAFIRYARKSWRQAAYNMHGPSAEASNNWVGSPTAKTIIVVEPNGPTKPNSFTHVDFQLASRTMSRILHELRADETDIAWINAFDPNFDMVVHAAHSGMFKGRQVIALGKKVSDRLSELRLHHYKAIHPSQAGCYALLKSQMEALLPTI